MTTTTWKYKDTGKKRYIEVHAYWVQNAVKHTYEYLWNLKIFRGLCPRIPQKTQNREGREDWCTEKRKGDGGKKGWDGEGRKENGKAREWRGGEEGRERRGEETEREDREVEGTGIGGKSASWSLGEMDAPACTWSRSGLVRLNREISGIPGKTLPNRDCPRKTGTVQRSPWA
jgi:hypothetical protein